MRNLRASIQGSDGNKVKLKLCITLEFQYNNELLAVFIQFILTALLLQFLKENTYVL